MARVVFRDTLVRSFRWGMRNSQAHLGPILHNYDAHIEAISALVESCLLLSADFQT
jgi:hypothetical protein